MKRADKQCWLWLGLLLALFWGGAPAAEGFTRPPGTPTRAPHNSRLQTASPQAGFQVSRWFPGQVFDAESGLYYYNALDYEPELGRFIQTSAPHPLNKHDCQTRI